jgi:hypothetical protein
MRAGPCAIRRTAANRVDVATRSVSEPRPPVGCFPWATGRRQPNQESILARKCHIDDDQLQKPYELHSKVLDNFVNQMSLRLLSITTHEA